MSAQSRRSFLASSAGLAAGATFLATQREATAAATPPGPAPDPGRSGSAPPMAVEGLGGTVVYIRDAEAGAVVIMDDAGEQSVVDPSLVLAIARAAGTKG